MGAAAMTVGGVQAAGGLSSAYMQGKAGDAQSSYYSYLADTARVNAGLADAEAVSERRQINADMLSNQVDLTDRINATVGAQKAAVVGGVGAASRSAQQIVKDTLNQGDLDEMALRLNADTRSRNAEMKAITARMNAESQASGYRIAGVNARSAATSGQIGSLLGTAGSVASTWYTSRLYKKP